MGKLRSGSSAALLAMITACHIFGGGDDAPGDAPPNPTPSGHQPNR